MPEHVEGLPRSSDLCSTGAIEQGDNTQVTSLEHRRLEGWLAAGIEPASRPCQSARTYHSCYGRLAAPQNQFLEKSAFPICDVHQLPGVLEELELQLAISGKAARVSFIVRRNVAGEIGE